MASDESQRYIEYRAFVAGNLLGPALRNAVLIFILLQTFVFIPADLVLYPEHFKFFLAARTALNIALGAIWLGAAHRWPAASSVAVCALGTALFLIMVQETGGVDSGYYVGLILLVVGMGFLTPQSAGQAGLISAMMFVSYLALPFYTRDPIRWLKFSENLFFLGAACAEACWACLHMDRLRFADFKQKRQLEQARDELAELDRAKSRFSANVHHELRTPLTLILAPLDALRDGEFGELSPLVQRTLATMQSNGRRLHKMINNLLDLSKVESNQFEIVRRKVRLDAIVEELVSGARPLAEKKGVDLRLSAFNNLPDLYADPDAIDKVLVNLVGNALKFTDRNGHIEISARGVDGGVEVCVSDTGIGIPVEKLDRIFDRFAQVDSSATRRYEGTGIGLALAKEMVERHGGTIWAESDGEGRGARVIFTIPQGEPDADVTEVALENDQGAAQGVAQSIAAVEADLRIEGGAEGDSLIELQRSVERWSDSVDCVASDGIGPVHDQSVPEVLIAEDNPDMRTLLSMLIGKEFRVRLTKNGREALESVRSLMPDLILSDVMMPEMSGIELCRAVKADREMSSVPFVLVTSKAEREMKIEGLEMGADDYVTKPFHPRELLARVRSLVRVASLQRQLAARNISLEEALRGLKQAEVQLVQSERLAAVGEVAAGIAHEINNPVNFSLNAARAVQSSVREICVLLGGDHGGLPGSGESKCGFEKLERGTKSLDRDTLSEMSEELIELSDIIIDGLARTTVLVGDLREFAAPGQSAAMSTAVDVAKGLRSTIALLKHLIEDAGVSCELQIEGNLPLIVANPGSLNQVFLNLIKNAAESYSGQAGVVRVSARRESSSLVIEIADSGTGIAPEHKLRLFEPFFTTKEVGLGTGLGLSISRQIVLAHGGTLEVWSEVGQGTIFTIRLPIEGSCSIAGVSRPDFSGDSIS